MNPWNRRTSAAVLCVALLASMAPADAPAPKKTPPAQPPAAEGWPREVTSGTDVFTLYQPQLESWDGSRLQAYSAIAVKSAGSETPVYGVVWFSARTSIGREERLVTLDEMQVERNRFPSAPDKEVDYLVAIGEYVAPRTKQIALDRFEAALAVLDVEKKADALPVKSDPPRIIFSKRPGLLVYVDGSAVYRPVEGTKLERIVNTRALVLRDGDQRNFLKVFDGWMEAPALDGPWTVCKKPPKDAEKAKETVKAAKQVDLLLGGDPQDPKTWPSLKRGQPPAIIVATTPTELIVTEGEANYVPLEGVELLYVKNTTGHVFKDLGDQKTYVLVSGRWFRGPSTEGPWENVANDALPGEFAKIPDDSPKENVKASVAGTPQAQEALISNAIPQTATVNRTEAKLAPVFDGEPQVAPIEGTTLKYVTNSPTPILYVEAGSWYAVDNGVWFASTTVKGPWAVASSVPAVIYSIPPSSPLHNVTYVKVYSSTATTVAVGYTPGYYGTCVSHGTVVYGTGYAYTPWVGSVWYGPPMTYGFGVASTYTPWTGWAFGYGFGWSWGTVTVGWGWGAYPWWGPAGWGYYNPYPYHPVYGGAAWGPNGAGVWGPGGWAATTGNVYRRWGNTAAVTRSSGGYNAWTGDRWSNQGGMSYNSRTGNLAAGQRSSVGNVYTGNYASGSRGAVTNTRTGNTVSGGRVTAGNAYTGQSGSAAWVRGEGGGVARVGEDVYAGRDGQVYRRGEGGGWEQANPGGGWGGVRETDRARTLDTQQRARSTGQQRTDQYRSSPAYRGGGGRTRGGGGRRR